LNAERRLPRSTVLVATATAIYTGVSDDYKNRVLAAALQGAFGGEGVAS
jgi:hypothetical protein